MSKAPDPLPNTPLADRLRHMVNGKTYYARDATPVAENMDEYRAQVRRAYGNLSGVKFKGAAP